MQADVVFAFYGFNESFKGYDGLEKFKEDLDKFIKESLEKNYSGKGTARLVLFGPAADEQSKRVGKTIREMARGKKLKFQIVSKDFLLPWGMLYMADAFDPERINLVPQPRQPLLPALKLFRRLCRNAFQLVARFVQPAEIRERRGDVFTGLDIPRAQSNKFAQRFQRGDEIA